MAICASVSGVLLMETLASYRISYSEGVRFVQCERRMSGPRRLRDWRRVVVEWRPKMGFLATWEVISFRGRVRAVVKMDWMVGWGRK